MTMTSTRVRQPRETPRPVDVNRFIGVKTTRQMSQLDDLDKYAQIAERMPRRPHAPGPRVNVVRPGAMTT